MTTQSAPVLRSLGTFERLLHLSSTGSPFRFVMAAHLGRHVALEEVRSAIDHVALAHPLLGVGVRDKPTPMFVDAELPVTDGGSGSWSDVAARLLDEPPRDEAAPLTRFALVHDPHGTSMLLVTEHEVMDGLAAWQVLREVIIDLGSSTGGGAGDRHYLPPAQEQLLSGERVGNQGPSAEFQDERMARLLEDDGVGGPPLKIVRITLTTTQSTTVRTASRAQRVTVNSTVLAAVAKVLADDSGFARIAVPIDLRRNGGLSPAVANRFLGTKVGLVDAHRQGFWPLARLAQLQVDRARSRQSLVATSAFLDEHAPIDVVGARVAIRERMSADAMLTNLGLLDAPEGVDVSGPMLRSGAAGERVIGVTSVAGSLSLVLTTRDDNAADLLGAMVRQLFDAAGM